MAKLFKYDLFISYCSVDSKIATYVCNKLETKGLKCFIAPRDISAGKGYALEIVNAISNSTAVLLIFSSKSDKSGFVLREVNSAVSRNKTIVPLRVENFLPSEAMEFYLGPTHWLDAFPEVLDTHISSIIDMVTSINRSFAQSETEKVIRYPNLTFLTLDELYEIGFTPEKVCMRALELDYLSVPTTKYLMNDETEGTFDEWLDTTKNDGDKTCFLVKNDQIVAYADFYLLNDGSFEELASGKRIIRDDMLAIYMFGGTFDAYLPLFSFDPLYMNEKNYMGFIRWVFNKIDEWEKQGIRIKRLGASAYSNLDEKMFTALGFEYTASNPARGKVFVTTIEKLKSNPIAKKIVC